MILCTSLLNTQHYKVRIKGKVEQSLHLGVVAVEKGAFESSSTTVANFTLFLFYSFESFSHQLVVFHGSLGDCKSLQVSRTLLSILADLNNAVVWMISTCFLNSKSSSLSTIPLGIVPMHHLLLLSASSCSIVFSSLARSWDLSLFSLSFNFTHLSAGSAGSIIRQVLVFVLVDNHYYSHFSHQR